MEVYSAVGNYSTNSSNLVVNSNYDLATANMDQVVGLKAAIAVAAGAVALAYETGYALGTIAHHAYDLLGGGSQLEPAMVDFTSYNPSDFSKFDN